MTFHPEGAKSSYVDFIRSVHSLSSFRVWPSTVRKGRNNVAKTVKRMMFSSLSNDSTFSRKPRGQTA